MRILLRPMLWASLGLCGCSRDEIVAKAGCLVGAKDCPCTAGGGCDPGLQCEAGSCVESISPTAYWMRHPSARTGGEMFAVVVVACARDGGVTVDGAPVEEAMIETRIQTRMRDERNLTGIVQCEPDVPFGRVIALLDKLVSAGIREYAVATMLPGAWVPPVPQPLP